MKIKVFAETSTVRIISVILGSLCLLFTVLPFIQTNTWWIRIFDFPRLQIAGLCLITCILLFIYADLRKLRYMFLIMLVGSALVYQTSLVARFTPLFPVEATTTADMRTSNNVTILHANIWLKNRQSTKFLELVQRYRPDIISVNEPDAWWEKQLAPLEERYAYTIKTPLANTYGMLLYSRLPLKMREINFLVVDDVPSFYAKVVLPTGRTFNLHSVHPEPPRPGSSTYERDTELFIVGKRIRREQKPSIVVGDLNDVAWSRTTKKFKEYGGVLDPRKGRGLYNTFNANWPLLRYPLDHFFFTPHFTLTRLKKLEDIGSDHFPILIELRLTDDQRLK